MVVTPLYLDHNQFSGRIPNAFYKLPFLKGMYIEGNNFKAGVLELSDSDLLVQNIYKSFDRPPIRYTYAKRPKKNGEIPKEAKQSEGEKGS